MRKFIFSSLLLLTSHLIFGQIEVKYFNAGWNAANDVSWVEKLSGRAICRSAANPARRRFCRAKTRAPVAGAAGTRWSAASIRR